jgi:hypothetical protein
MRVGPVEIMLLALAIVLLLAVGAVIGFQVGSILWERLSRP